MPKSFYLWEETILDIVTLIDCYARKSEGKLKRKGKWRRLSVAVE